eukprot:jgi/Psemu1/61833/gm1.61833_g
MAALLQAAAYTGSNPSTITIPNNKGEGGGVGPIIAIVWQQPIDQLGHGNNGNFSVTDARSTSHTTPLSASRKIKGVKNCKDHLWLKWCGLINSNTYDQPQPNEVVGRT